MAVSQNARIKGTRPFGVVFDKMCLVCGGGYMAGRIKVEAGEFERGSYLNFYNDLPRIACTNPRCKYYDDLTQPR